MNLVKYEKIHRQKIQTTYFDCLDKPLGIRLHFLAEVAKDDIALFQIVESLLLNTHKNSKFTQKIDAATALLGDLDKDWTGKRLGNYRIISLISQGGMGDVYLAQRDDAQFDMQVAIKIIRSTSFSADSLDRFKIERQILADLKHDNIARLIDGGTSADGYPYIVMEYVQGTPIDEYCHQHKLSLDARLKLFQKVCEALSFAHQNLIVHCDIKPLNILVSNEGQPKLLDFGISTLLSNSDIKNQSNSTVHDSKRLSVQYTSPEQISGQPINILCDVFSLGIVLYQILTGQRPFERQLKDLLGPQGNISILKPSEQLAQQVSSDKYIPLYKSSLKKIIRKLRFDIDYIVCKAIQTSPQDRYTSIDNLSQDISRTRANMPVLARPKNWFYYIHTFLLRHSISSLLAVITLVSLISFSVITVKQNQQIKSERDIASVQRDKAKAVTKFVTSMLKSTGPRRVKSSTITVRETLDKAYAQLVEDDQLTKHPLVRAEMYSVVGNLYSELGLYPQAQKSLETATQIFSQYAALHTPEAVTAFSELAINYTQQSMFIIGVSTYQKSIRLSKQVHGPDHDMTLGIIANLAGTMMQMGQLSQAKKTYEELLDKRKRLFGSQHHSVISTNVSIGIINQWLGNYAQAKTNLQQCVKDTEKAGQKLQSYYLTCIAALGSVLESMGEYTEAAPIIQKHIILATEVFGLQHPNVLRSQHNLADVLYGMGQLTASQELFEQTLTQRTSVLGPEHIETLQSQMKLGRVLLRQKKYNLAGQHLESMWQVHSKRVGATHQTSLLAKRLLADLYRAQQTNELAVKTYTALLEHYSSIDHVSPEQVNVLAGLSLTYLAQTHPALAERSLTQATEIASSYKETHFPRLREALSTYIAQLKTNKIVNQQQQLALFEHKLAELLN
ncbi:MAG: serine/threonine protein kinase [Paraglaciecola sp.]|nr:serine/threonine protein kinase [Paraglaciecola sp.]